MNRIKATLQYVYAAGFRKRLAFLQGRARDYAAHACREADQWTGRQADIEAVACAAFKLWMFNEPHLNHPLLLANCPLADCGIALGAAVHAGQTGARELQQLLDCCVSFTKETSNG